MAESKASVWELEKNVIHRLDSHKPKIEIFFGEAKIKKYRKYESKWIQTEEPFMLG